MNNVKDDETPTTRDRTEREDDTRVYNRKMTQAKGAERRCVSVYVAIL
jgi:hypothetical protein